MLEVDVWHKDGDSWYLALPNSARQIGLRQVRIHAVPWGWALIVEGQTYDTGRGSLSNETCIVMPGDSIASAKIEAISKLQDLLRTAIDDLGLAGGQ